MDVLPITPFLASAAQMELDRVQSSDFRSFLALAEKSSGEPAHRVDVASVLYRVADARNGQQHGLKLADRLNTEHGSQVISGLIESSLKTDRTLLIHSLWKLEGFEDIKAWLKAMRVLVRFARDPEGATHGHLLLAETVIAMVETVERRDYVLPNGDMASDAITRNFGVRAKVFALDRARRTPRTPGGNSHSMMDRLSRTLSKSSR